MSDDACALCGWSRARHPDPSKFVPPPGSRLSQLEAELAEARHATESAWEAQAIAADGRDKERAAHERTKEQLRIYEQREATNAVATERDTATANALTALKERDAAQAALAEARRDAEDWKAVAEQWKRERAQAWDERQTAFLAADVEGWRKRCLASEEAHERTKAELAEARSEIEATWTELQQFDHTARNEPLSECAAVAVSAYRQLEHSRDDERASREHTEIRLGDVRDALACTKAERDELQRELDEEYGTRLFAEAERDAAQDRADKAEADAERLHCIGDLLADNGCNCDCDHHPDEHDDDCERCLACRIGAVLTGKGTRDDD